MKRTVALIACVLVASMIASAQMPQPLPSALLEKIPQHVKDQAPMFSGNAAMMKALVYNLDLKGKSLPALDGVIVPQKPKKITDVPIAYYNGSPEGYALREDEPYGAANPVNKKYMVAVSHSLNPGSNYYSHCIAYSSSDNGATWTQEVAMPMNGTHFCSDPVVAYSPDGKRVYYAYMNIVSNFYFDSGQWGYFYYYYEDMDILVSRSDDNGLHWSAPVTALDGDATWYRFYYNAYTNQSYYDYHYGYEYDKPWVATSSFDEGQSNYAYVTATRFDVYAPGDIHIAFTRSTDKGLSFNAPKILETSGYDPHTSTVTVVQGSRPASGTGPEVLVAWYNSGDDGWLTGNFQIHTRYSTNNGSTFGSVKVAASDQNEIPYWLGPNFKYHRWWGGMFPSLAMDARGQAHIAYTYTPTQSWNFQSSESGDIRYLRADAPFSSWSTPITVNDDGTEIAQGYPAVAVEKQGTVHLVWEDHRLSSQDNMYYDMFWTRLTPGEPTFSPNRRVSDTTSVSAFVFIGDYTGIALNDTTLFTVWTDRRADSDIFEYNNDIYGSRIIPKQ